MVFLFQNYGKFWSISLDNFIKHNPLISEEWPLQLVSWDRIHTLNWVWAEETEGGCFSEKRQGVSKKKNCVFCPYNRFCRPKIPKYSPKNFPPVLTYGPDSYTQCSIFRKYLHRLLRLKPTHFKKNSNMKCKYLYANLLLHCTIYLFFSFLEHYGLAIWKQAVLKYGKLEYYYIQLVIVYHSIKIIICSYLKNNTLSSVEVYFQGLSLCLPFQL